MLHPSLYVLSLIHSSIFEDAFNDAKAKFSFQPSQDKRKVDVLRSKQSLQEVQDIVTQSMAKYEERNKDSKARKWFERFSKKIVFYGNILDVFVEHHPEFVALAWGAMKLVFTVFISFYEIVVMNKRPLICVAGGRE